MTDAPETMEMSRPRSGAANGRLWGMRARDWADIQERQCAEAYHMTLDKASVGSGTRVLDAGCGAGMAASLAAELGAVVSGIDASEALVDVARSRLPDSDFHVGDLEELPFQDDGFDVVTGFNAFQFASDPIKALSEARRVTAPGGKICVMTWGDPEGMEAVALVASLKGLLPPPPPGAAGPFALSDESKLRGLAAEAGLRPLEVFDVDTAWTYPDLATGLRGLRSSGVASKAAETSGEAAVDAAHEAALSTFRQPDGGYKIGASFRILMAAPE